MLTKIVNLIFEVMHLKNLDHQGWKYLHIKQPDTVAEHSLNAAQIGYILAKLEGVDANKIATMLVWHEIPETRIGDFHKIAVRYIKNKKDLEREVMDEQLEGLSFAEEIKGFAEEMEKKETHEGKIAKDADYLEQAFQGKIYKEMGYEDAQNRITNVGNALRTESAKKIRKLMCETKSSDRRINLKNLKNV